MTTPETATAELVAAIEDRSNKQVDIAALYQTALMFQVEFVALSVNAAIIDRWSLAGLKNIKRLAWSGRPVKGTTP